MLSCMNHYHPEWREETLTTNHNRLRYNEYRTIIPIHTCIFITQTTNKDIHGVFRTFATLSQSFNKLNSKSVQYTIFKGRSKNYNSELRSRHKSLRERKRRLKDGFRGLKEGSKMRDELGWKLKEGSRLRDELGRRWQLISTLWKKNTISISEPYKKKIKLWNVSKYHL